jgi:hypothetical protein
MGLSFRSVGHPDEGQIMSINKVVKFAAFKCGEIAAGRAAD